LFTSPCFGPRGPKPSSDAQGVVLDEAGGFLDIAARTSWQGRNGFGCRHALCDERVGKLLDAIAHVSRTVSRRSGDRVPVVRGDIGGLSFPVCDVLRKKLIRPLGSGPPLGMSSDRMEKADGKEALQAGGDRREAPAG
jgi:hypothetical protein